MGIFSTRHSDVSDSSDDSDDSELPSVEELLSSTSVGLTLKSEINGCVLVGSSSMLDEDEHDGRHGAVTPCHGDPNLNTASSADLHDPSHLSTDPSFVNRCSRESECVDEEPAGGREEAPASAGRVYDIFADFEQRLNMKKLGQQAQSQKTTRHRGVHDNPDRTVVSSSSVKRSVCDGSQTASIGDVGTEEHTRVVNGHPGLCHSSRVDTTEEPTSQPRQGGVELDRTTHVTLFEGCISHNSVLPVSDASSADLPIVDNASLMPHEATGNIASSRAVPVSRNPSTWKRPLQSSESSPSLPGDPTSERPPHVTRESRKAREAREQAAVIPHSQCRPRSRPRRSKRAAQASPNCDGNEGHRQIAGIEDVYLSEDGTVYCVVQWQASLVAREHLGGKALGRRCAELLRKKYGSQA